ncbi:MAG TPA: HK97 family phage prohead protease [Bacteroidales bacterium]|nr:HK97 family phage prohead protease [Bacteroidales bacterium]
MDYEIRSISHEAAEIRAAKDSRKVEGYGIVFNSRSKNLGGFYEIILPGAVDGVLDNSDVMACMDHNLSRGILARSSFGSGSMSLKVDTKGVQFGFVAPNFPLGDELLEGIRRGDIRNASFAFTVATGGEKWVKQDDGTYLRTISKFEQIYDMSPCYTPAYQDTKIATRSLTEVQKSEGGTIPNPTGSDPEGKLVTIPESYFTNLEDRLNYKR